MTALADELSAWLRRVAAEERPPDSVVAYNIGLFETGDGYSAYLVGATRYDPGDSDWACDEAFTPHDRYLALPLTKTGTNWKSVLEQVADAAREWLGSREGAATFFAKSQAVTVGFDDGDLLRVK